MKGILTACVLLIVFATQTLEANGSLCCGSPFDGLYVTGNVGFTRFTASTYDADAFFADTGNFEEHDTSWLLGGGVGYNYTFCNTLIGVVADWNYANAVGKFAFLTDSTNLILHHKTALHWFSTFRGRLGLTCQDLLLYVTGGAALADIKQTFDYTRTFTPLFSTHQTFDKKLWGWTLGFGAEWALGSCWSIHAEWLYLNFERQNITLRRNTVNPFDLKGYHEAWVGRVGINYHFSLGRLLPW